MSFIRKWASPLWNCSKSSALREHGDLGLGTFENLEGEMVIVDGHFFQARTLVGFWTPEYAKTFNVPGYHLHFLSADHQSGGHLLQCAG
jgi:alpha-acetolactate decarboxylase